MNQSLDLYHPRLGSFLAAMRPAENAVPDFAEPVYAVWSVLVRERAKNCLSFHSIH